MVGVMVMSELGCPRHPPGDGDHTIVIGRHAELDWIATVDGDLTSHFVERHPLPANSEPATKLSLVMRS